MMFLPSLKEVVFPVGQITTKIPFYICPNCQNVFFESNCLKIRYDHFTALKSLLLKKKGLDFDGAPESYVDELEFSGLTGQEITNENRKWFLKGLFGVLINNKAFFLKKSIDEYIHTDYGMFWLSDQNFDDDCLILPGCPWCGIGQVIKKENGKYICGYCGETMNHLILRKAV